MDTDRELRALLDRVAIEDVLYLYCETIDEKGWDRFDQVFAPDVTAHFPGGTVDEGAEGQLIEGREQVVHFLQAAFAHLGITHHLVSTVRLGLDGDTASYSCRVRAYHANAYYKELFEESLGLFAGTMARTPDGWRIASWREEIPILLGTRRAFDPPTGTRGNPAG